MRRCTTVGLSCSLQTALSARRPASKNGSVNHLMTWLGIALCLSQSAMFSGLNLAVFSLSRLRLEAAAAGGDANASRVLALRRDANYALTTILWGNVAVNVLLTLLADSLLAGITAFLFATVVITLAAEIMPQAYFSRNALRIAALLSPVLRFYQVLLAPVAWPSARLLDAWIGPEGIPWFRERELRQVLEHHARRGSSEISRLEATGAINFLALDDLPVGREGEPLHPDSIIRLPFRDERAEFPEITRTPEDPFLRRLALSGKKWIVLTDERNEPRLVTSGPNFIRAALFGGDNFDPPALCHHPLIVRDATRPLGQVLGRLTVQSETPGDDVIDKDLILVWAESGRRIITGSDLLGRLLRKIARSN
jgi:metal transporter CNNM